MTAAAAAVSPAWGGAPRFDNHAFENKRSRAVSADTEISFSDFERMHVARRSPKLARRLPDPDFASDISKLKRLVVAVCENSIYLANHRTRPFDETRPFNERLDAIAKSAVARLPGHREALDKLIDRHHWGQKNGMAKAQLRALQIQITNLDSRIRILPRIAVIVTAVLYRYYFLGWNSVQTCNGLPVKPVMVRQMCRRARLVWDRVTGTQQLFALPNGEYLEMVAPSLKQRKRLGIGRPSIWTPEREETLVRLFNEGKTWRVILGEVGVCYETARHMVHRKGLTRTRTRTRRAPAPRNDRRTTWTPERIAELVRLCSLGVSWRAIAEELGTCTATVMKMALRKQITKPRAKRRSKAPRPAAGDRFRIRKAQSSWTGDRLQELRRLSDDGFSWHEIGKRLGVGGVTARVAAVRHNILRKRTPQGWSK